MWRVRRLEESIEEVVSLVIDEEEGGEVDDIDLPDGFHSELGVLQALHLPDVFFGQNGGGSSDGPEIESSVLLAGVGDLLGSVSLRQRDHGAALGHERPHVGVHAAGGRGAEGSRSHALRGLGGSRVVDDVVLHVLGHFLAAVEALHDLGVRDVASHDDRSGKREARLHRVLAHGLQDLAHRTV